MPRRLVLLALATTLLQGPGLAQQLERQRLAGRVLDVSRKPVAGARVILLHRPIPSRPTSGPADRLTVETNAQGFFQAKVLPDRTYSVWASWRDRASRFAEAVEGGGGFVTLQEDPLARPSAIRVEGAEAWKDRSPLSYQVAVGSENIDLIAISMRDGLLRVPVLPSGQSPSVEVLDREGAVLWAEQATRVDPPTLRIPTPVEIDVLVRDAETDKPIGGAHVLWHIRNYWFTSSSAVHYGDRFRALWPRAAVTGADGTARLRVAARSDPRLPDTRYASLHLMAIADGYRSSLSGWNNRKPYRDGMEVEADKAGKVVTFSLQSAKPQFGVVRLTPERNVTAGQLEVISRVWVKGLEGGGSGMPFHAPVLEIANGRFTMPRLPANSDIERVVVQLPDAERRVLEGAVLPLSWRLPHPEALVDSELAQLAPGSFCRIEVRGPFGRPAERALVLGMPVVNDKPRPNKGHRFRCDRLGRGVLRLPETRPVRVVVLTADGWGIAQIDAQDVTESVKVSLRAMPVVEGTVVDDAGQPVPFATVRVARFKKNGDVGTDLRAEEAGYLANTLAPTVTDAAGRFRLAYFPAPGRLQLEVFLRNRPRERAATGSVECDQLEDPAELRLVVSSPKGTGR